MKWLTRLMAFTGAATVVIAQTFILVDPNGIIAAQQTATTLNGNPVDSLQMMHRDAAVRDSLLAWTHNPTGNTQTTTLRGPSDAGITANPPRLELDASATQSRIQIDSGSSEAAFLGSSIQFNSHIGAALAGLFILADKIDLATPDAVKDRGDIFGVSHHEATLGGNTTLAVGGTTLITINLPETVLGDSFAHITWTVDANALLAAPGLMTARIGINGALQPQFATFNQAAAGDRGTVGNTYNYAIPITGAAVAITLVGAGPLNAWQAITSGTTLTIIYYR